MRTLRFDAEIDGETRRHFIVLVPHEQGGDDPAAIMHVAGKDDPCLWLASLWVHPAYRRRGFGDILVREALDYAEERGKEAVSLSVASGNDAAVALYRKHGFRTAFLHQFSDGPRWIMTRTLQPESDP